MSASSASRPLTEQLRAVQRGRCYLCARLMTPVTSAPTHRLYPTVDHIRPRGLHGVRWFPNIALACLECNGRKGGRMPRPCERLFGVVVAEMLNGRTTEVLRPNTPADRAGWKPGAPQWENRALAEALRAALTGTTP